MPATLNPGRPRRFCCDAHARQFHNDKRRTAIGEIKRRGPRNEGPRATHCQLCDKELTGRQRQFCCNEHAERFWNELRMNGVGEGWHRLTDVDEEQRVATCSQHGPNTPIVKGSKNRFGRGQQWRCAIQSRVKRDAASREAGWRKRGIIDMTYERYEAMLDEQDWCCAACGRDFGDTPHVDHDHQTGVARGLLCSNCNCAIGYLGESVETARLLVRYLERTT